MLTTSIAGVLLQAIGLDFGRGSCETGILLCISLYSTSKLFVYLFLGEHSSHLVLADIEMSSRGESTHCVVFDGRHTSLQIAIVSSLDGVCASISRRSAPLVGWFVPRCLHQHSNRLPPRLLTVRVASFHMQGVCFIGLKIEGVILLVVFDV